MILRNYIWSFRSLNNPVIISREVELWYQTSRNGNSSVDNTIHENLALPGISLQYQGLSVGKHLSLSLQSATKWIKCIRDSSIVRTATHTHTHCLACQNKQNKNKQKNLQLCYSKLSLSCKISNEPYPRYSETKAKTINLKLLILRQVNHGENGLRTKSLSFFCTDHLPFFRWQPNSK